MDPDPMNLLRRIPYRKHATELHRSLTLTHQVPVNRSIRQYFDEADDDDDNDSSNKPWLKKPELPTAGEILGKDAPGDDVLLAANKIKGPWPSKNEYLETHYNLIREDSVAPLRDAVTIVRNDPHMHDVKNISIYEKVFITQVTLAQRGLAVRIRFSTRRAGKKILWEYSNRLISSTIVALSPVSDAFATKCVVAVVAARSLENVTKNPPEVDIFFAQPEDFDFDPQQEWLMVEARSGYFEAQRHTMTALQQLSRERFPLSEHICDLNTDIKVPQHIECNPMVDLGTLSRASTDEQEMLNVLEQFPPAPMGELDVFQWSALKEILTKSLPIIQGPPGTGKTYVSVEALRVLLAHMVPGDPPIIIATHTNHALDQLITHVSHFEKEYIRLGGRSTDPEVRKRSLPEIRQSLPSIPISGGLLDAARKELQRIASQINTLLGPFDKEGRDGPLSGSVFATYGLLTQAQCDSLQHEAPVWVNVDAADDVKDPISLWLGNQVKKFQVNYPSDNFSFTEHEVDMEYEQLMELEAEQGQGSDEWEGLRGKTIRLEETFRGRQTGNISEASIREYLKNENLWKIPVAARGAVYNHLRSQLVNIVRKHVRALAKAYAIWAKKVLVGKWERDHEILRTAKLIGMTTTGLSKYRALVSSLNPRVVMIEEAAEVLEGPVAAACFESVQQLILVGDHQQLKGHCALHDLEGEPFYLDVSMFERLVGNDLPFVKLQEQRRMAPEIRKMLTPIYGQLQDHSSVHEYPQIPGMGDIRAWFFSHQWPESGDSLSSKTNDMEAVMIVEFYVYLVLNGVDPARMTVLTFYNGQRKLLLKNMKSNPYLAHHMPKVLTVDSYQGEENDIVLLSLVRSNRFGEIGFVAVDNRACVALSRAKHGFYIFGNAEALITKSQLWSDVVSLMTIHAEKKCLGPHLPLTCQKHHKTTYIKDLPTWSKINGGCEAPCGGILQCGHECPLRCHGFDHDWVSCEKLCAHVQPCCGVECSKKCGTRHVHSCRCMEESAPAAKSETNLLIEFEGSVARYDSAAGSGGSKSSAKREVVSTAESWMAYANRARETKSLGARRKARQASSTEEKARTTMVDETFIELRKTRPVAASETPSESAVGTPAKDSPESTSLLPDLIDFSDEEPISPSGHLLD